MRFPSFVSVAALWFAFRCDGAELLTDIDKLSRYHESIFSFMTSICMYGVSKLAALAQALITLGPPSAELTKGIDL